MEGYNHLSVPKTRTYHGRVGAGGGRAAHSGAAGQGGVGQDGTPTGRFDQETTDPVALQGIEDKLSKLSFGITNERILCKPREEQNPRLTRGLSAVYPQFISAVDNRFIRGTTAALRSWLLTSVPTPICLRKPFSCKACSGNRYSNSKVKDLFPLIFGILHAIYSVPPKYNIKERIIFMLSYDAKTESVHLQCLNQRKKILYYLRSIHSY